MAHEWINPDGPFKSLRNLLGALLFLGFGLGVFTLFAPASMGGDDGVIFLLMLFIIGPGILVLIGAAWVIDNILSYMKG
ncbi:hypothetical protein A4G99_03735 [Haladaptatus sp. R4]|uniref:hypothetical protein n=1 Tax=Haladaptatus sp. R4 TaxID=1679489 RepID=UPI0007B4F5CB|nr:hypothetical protein [Haladaptatus sp. R4]KZN25591.1 hypothetical protein A4G99_03735 [Haladaptatus sp. R4]